MSRLASELRRVALLVSAAAYFGLAPSSLPPWRLDAAEPPAYVLPVGEPVQRLGRS